MSAPRRADYPPNWTTALAAVAWRFTHAVTEAAADQAGDGWDLRTDDPATEIAQLRRRLDDVAAAIDEARQVLDDIEAHARSEAAGRREPGAAT